MVTFYDGDRVTLGRQWLGPFQGTSDWFQKTETIRVPPEATEAILRIGLFGAVGEIGFDSIRIRGSSR